MKHKDIQVAQRDQSSKRWMQVAISAFIIMVLFFFFYKPETAPKIAPETSKQTSICSSENFPVCGKDGKTYANSCTAEKIADVRVAYVGECRAEITESTGTITPTESVSQVTTTIENTGSLSDIETPPVYTDIETITSTGILTESTASGMTLSASGLVDPTLITYANSSYRYAFSMPKNSYYQAFGAQNGASHSVGISSGTGVESLIASQVRVYLYANKIIENLATAENGFYTDPTSGAVYLLLNNKDSVMIESDNPESALVQTIIRTIYRE